MMVKWEDGREAGERGAASAEFEASGLSRGEFCRNRRLKVSTLDAYRKRRRRAQGEPAGAARWVAVQVSGARQPDGSAPRRGLVVVLGEGRRIETEREFDAATLAQLLSVLERS